jgi:8-amino-7-oxononanoate synthase
MAGQIRAALRLAQGMDIERKMLLNNSRSLATSLHEDGWNVCGTESQIVPAIIGSNEDALGAANFLQERGLAVRAIRPPTVPAGTARLRLSLTARITTENLSSLRAAMRTWRESKASCASVGRA